MSYQTFSRWKNEVPHGSIIEAVAIRSKVYALRIKKHSEGEEMNNTDEKEDLEEMKRMKGVRKPIVKERIEFSDYLNTLYGKPLYVTFNKIASKIHIVSTVECRKRAMTSFDDKRFILPCKIHSFPYESTEIEKYSGQCPTCCNT